MSSSPQRSQLSFKNLQVNSTPSKFRDSISIHQRKKESNNYKVQNHLIDNYCETIDSRINDVILQKQLQFGASYQKLQVLIERADQKLRKLKTMLPLDQQIKNNELFSYEQTNIQLGINQKYNQELCSQVNDLNLKIDDQLFLIKEQRKVTQYKKERIKQLMQDYLVIMEQYNLRQNINSNRKQNLMPQNPCYESKTTRSLSSRKNNPDRTQNNNQIDNYGLESLRIRPAADVKIDIKLEKLKRINKNLKLKTAKIDLVKLDLQKRILYNHSLLNLFSCTISHSLDNKAFNKQVQKSELGFSTKPTTRIQVKNKIQHDEKKNIQEYIRRGLNQEDFLCLSEGNYQLFLEEFQEVIAYQLNNQLKSSHIRSMNLSQHLKQLYQL